MRGNARRPAAILRPASPIFRTPAPPARSPTASDLSSGVNLGLSRWSRVVLPTGSHEYSGRGGAWLSNPPSRSGAPGASGKRNSSPSPDTGAVNKGECASLKDEAPCPRPTATHKSRFITLNLCTLGASDVTGGPMHAVAYPRLGKDVCWVARIVVQFAAQFLHEGPYPARVDRIA